MEQLVEEELAGETRVIGKNLPQCQFVNPGRRSGKPTANRLSYDTAWD
jgi:hypothetical protein